MCIRDSYQALRNGADFGSLAKQLSQDPTTAQKGGDLPYIVTVSYTHLDVYKRQATTCLC